MAPETNWFNKCCELQNRLGQLQAELAEAKKKPEPYCSICGSILKDGPKKKPEPMEFDEIRFVHPVKNSPLLEVVYLSRTMTPEQCIRNLCNRINSLTAENAKQKEVIDYAAAQDKQSTKGILELEAELKAKTAALEKLAKLGNEPYLGNSEGNVIAQQALKGESKDKTVELTIKPMKNQY